MKELKLPKAIPIRFYFDGEKPKTQASGDVLAEMAIIEKNGLEIMSATIMMEDRMIEAVGKLLFDSNNENREFFENEIMGASDFSYAFKRKAFTRLLEHKNVIDAVKLKKLKAGLNKIMEWRNAFAHGKVLHEHNGGFILQYYSGGHRELVLDDDFFENAESTIRDCLYTCNGIIQSQ